MYYKRSGMRLVVATITLVLIFGCGILARPRANAAETTGNTVSVSTVDELLAAIAPGTTIELAAGTYDLSTASDYGGNGTDYYYWAKNVDGPSLVIHDIDGLSIRAMDTASGATTLTAVPRYADVLSFRNCDNFFLEGFTVGHTKELGVCTGGVLDFQYCHHVSIKKMYLYGCGTLGVMTQKCSSFDILRTEIYECSQGAGFFFQTDGIRFEDCSVHDVPSPAFDFYECGDMTWNGKALDGLDSGYDVDESGTAVTYEKPRMEIWEFHGGVENITNSRALEPLQHYEADTPMAMFTVAVQQAIASDNWESLADRMGYPVQFFTDGYSFVIHNREEYLNMVRDGYFTNEVFTETFRFRDRIAEADTSESGLSAFGRTCLDHMVAFSNMGEEETEETLKITAISVKTPLWPGRLPEDTSYVQVAPPTPIED